jgi:predicted DNA-binding transcriptional regulator YafY
VLHFKSQAADYVREKKWHESQQLRPLKNGGVEMRLTLSSLKEIKRWALSWGGDVTVIKPAELVAQVRAAAEQILAGR